MEDVAMGNVQAGMHVHVDGVAAAADADAEQDIAPITLQEMVEMFGEQMPIEAVNLLWDSAGTKTIGEVRAELRALAVVRKRMTWREGMEYWRAWAQSTEKAADIEEDAARIHAFYAAMSKYNRHPLMLNLDNEMPAEVISKLGMGKP